MECKCKLQLGLSNLFNLKTLPEEDALVKNLDTNKIVKGNSSFTDFCTYWKHETFDRLIAIPPDHESFQKAVVNNDMSQEFTDDENEDERNIRMKDFKAFFAEDAVYGKSVQALRMKGNPAFAIKNFHSGDYLVPLKDDAKAERKNYQESILLQKESVHKLYTTSNNQEKEVREEFVKILKCLQNLPGLEEKEVREELEKILNCPQNSPDQVSASKQFLDIFEGSFGKNGKKFDFERHLDDYVDDILSQDKSFPLSYAPLNNQEKDVIDRFDLKFDKKDEFVEISPSNWIPSDSASKIFKETFKEDFVKSKKLFNIRYKEKYADYMLYKDGLAKRSMEIDTLLILPEEKLVIEIESKSITEEKNFAAKIKDASKQLENFRNFLAATQRDILSENWQFVKVIALPLIQNIFSEENRLKMQEKKLDICEHCANFVLDEKKLHVIHEWIETTRKTVPEKFRVDHEYRNLVTRIVLFSALKEKIDEASLSLVKNREKHAEHMIGDNTGLTNEKPEGENNSGLQAICSEKTFILWRMDQLAALKDNYPRVLLDGDYGTGKTFLLKAKAQEIAEKSKKEAKDQEIAEKSKKEAKDQEINENHVLYLSLAAAADEKTDLQKMRKPSILEICDEIDFEEFPNIKVQGFQEIYDEYEADFGESRSTDLDEILCHIISKKENRAKHIFIDELPFWIDLLRVLKGIPGILEADEEIGGTPRYIWIANRPRYNYIGLDTGENCEHQETMETLKESPFSFRMHILRENVRNASNVCNFIKATQADDFEYDCSAETARLPPHSVLGNNPVLIHTKESDVLHTSIRLVLKKYFEDPKEPVVVLCLESSSSMMRKIHEDLMSNETGRNVLIFHPDASDRPLEEQEQCLREYIQNPEGLLLTCTSLFGGMQARNVIVFTQDIVSIGNMDALLRSTTFLVLITSQSEIAYRSEKFLDQELNTILGKQ